MALFPGALPAAGTASASDTLATAGHTSLHNTGADESRALGTKIGTGSSPPSSGTLLRGTGPGTSAWADADLTTDVTGVLPQANGGTGQTGSTGTGVVVYQTSPTLITPTVSDFTNANHTHQNTAGGGTLTGAALQPNTVGFSKLALGTVVQVVNTNSSTVATGTTTIPADNTIPQNTEGDQYITLSITPKVLTNVLVVEACVLVSHSAAVSIIGALFQDATASAVGVGTIRNSAAGEYNHMTVKAVLAAGTISSTTLKLRIGGDGAGTTTFNGSGGSQLFGGIASLSTITITEYNA